MIVNIILGIGMMLGALFFSVIAGLPFNDIVFLALFLGGAIIFAGQR